MKSIMNEKCKVSVEIGGSWLSQDEVETFVVGDIIKLNSYGGDSHKLLFNGQYIASCEFVILTDIWGALVTNYSRPPERLTPSVKNSLTEILPISVRLGSGEYSLEELYDLGTGSVLSLDEPFTEAACAELIVAGIPAARGEIVLLYDNYGLRLTEIYRPGKEDLKIARSTGNLFKAIFGSDFCRECNFKRPDKFTKTAIHKVHDVHNAMLVILKNRYPELESWSMKSVDQLAFYECFDQFEKMDVSYLTLQERQYGKEKTRTFNRLIEPVEPNNQLDKSIYKLIEDFSKESKKEGYNYAFLCAMDRRAKKILEGTPSPLLSASWRNAVDFNFKELNLSGKLDNIKKVNSNEMILIVHMGPKDKDVKMGTIDSEGLYFIYPYLTLAPVANLLNI